MSKLAAAWGAKAPYLLGIMRIIAAFMFMQSGTVKMFGWPKAMPGGGTVDLMSQMGIGATLEIVGGFLILIGLFTRPVAFILSGMMAVAYFQFHFPTSFWTVVNNGSPAVLFCFLWLYYSMVGPGKFSVDRLRGRVQ